MASKEMGSHSSHRRCQARTRVSIIGGVEDLARRLASRSSKDRLRLVGCAALSAASKDALA